VFVGGGSTVVAGTDVAAGGSEVGVCAMGFAVGGTEVEVGKSGAAVGGIRVGVKVALMAWAMAGAEVVAAAGTAVAE